MNLFDSNDETATHPDASSPKKESEENKKGRGKKLLGWLFKTFLILVMYYIFWGEKIVRLLFWIHLPVMVWLLLKHTGVFDRIRKTLSPVGVDSKF